MNEKENMEPDMTFVEVMNELTQPALLSFLQYLMKAGYMNYQNARDTQAQINGCMREIDHLQQRIEIKKAVK